MVFLLKRKRYQRILIGLFLTINLQNPLYAYNAYSNSELEELEKEFIQQINQSSQVIRNPLAKQYINHLAKRLSNQKSGKIPYFFLVDSNEINAFAGPGGYIGVNSQLIIATDNESELAAVMAHEMAHVRMHHLYRMLEHSKQMRVPMLASILASMALGMVNPALASGALIASFSGIAQDSINFTRANEKEADRIGIDMLIKSGLNPQGMAGFFRKLQLNSRYYYRDNIPALLRTHPLDEDRIAEAENRSHPEKNRHYDDSVDYAYFKEIIRTISTKDNQQLLEFYQKQCRQNNKVNACKYGQALTLTNLNQFAKAKEILQTLTNDDKGNIYTTIALAQAEMGQKEYDRGLARLKELYDNLPGNYAIIYTYGIALAEARQAEKASSILLKASREYKNDLSICIELAQAQAAANHKDYAYFTQAQCELLQGRTHAAMQQLKIAQGLAQKDHMLSARITAKQEEIKQLIE